MLHPQASKELIAKATEVYKKAVKSAIKALSGEAESEDKEKDRRKSKSKKAEKAAAETPAAHIEIPAERRKEILKHLLNSARRLKNLHGEKWDEVKKGLALAKLEKAVGGDKEGVKSVAAQLSAL